MIRRTFFLLFLFSASCFLFPCRALQAGTGAPGHTCLKCHEALKNEISAQLAHEPVKKMDCTACHNPHASNEKKLLLEPPERVCLTCHEELAASLPKGLAHEPAQTGKCLDCHRPHSSPRKNLLVAPPSDLCNRCH